MRVTLSIPGNDSLKGKRRVVRRVLDRVRNRFGAAAAEVERLDDKRCAVLGFAVISNSGSHANSMLDKISEFIPGLTEAFVVDSSLELMHVSPEHAAADSVPASDDEWWSS
jgi:uncharacterized protein YlxP (DUF503 family)